MRLFPNRRSWALAAAIGVAVVFVLYYDNDSRSYVLPKPLPEVGLKEVATAPTSSIKQFIAQTTSARRPASTWSKLKQNYPVHSTIALPTLRPGKTNPQIQHKFSDSEIADIADVQHDRRNAVKEVFQHAWSGYKGHAWLKDEVSPISGESRNSFGGLAATLVDSLDSLWILELREGFEDAVKAVAEINFTKPDETKVSLFEYTIRYLGGLLGAYEISGRQFPILLDKAIEIGDLLYTAFDTPNRMPITYLDWKASLEGKKKSASDNTRVAELGSLSLEFTTLSRMSNNAKYYDAIQRVTDELQKAQNNTRLPGMWPITVDARTPSFSGDNTFTLGAMSDSLYEYLPKVSVPSIWHNAEIEHAVATPPDEWRDFSIS